MSEREEFKMKNGVKVNINIGTINYVREWVTNEGDNMVVAYSGTGHPLYFDMSYEDFKDMVDYLGWFEILSDVSERDYEMNYLINPDRISYFRPDRYDTDRSIVYFTQARKNIIASKSFDELSELLDTE